ncbi:MAG TPA: SDR family oxidoreductase [Pseudonocardiaceae bacterium]|nr:SDR family oxidoreductase [Pseudonocardiaceae bacterium]
MTELAGRVALITGAGSRGEAAGTGQATAILFAREGASVVLFDADERAARTTAESIQAEGGTCTVVVGDVTSDADCARAVAAAVDTWGRLDVLHNNVGVSSVGTVVDVAEDEWDRLMAVNVKSIMLTGRHAIPAMAGGGSIINTSSVSAMRPRGLTGYSAAKGAVITLTRAMAVDHGAAGIRVNCVIPGPLYTSMALADGMTDEKRERRRESSVLGIEGTGWDVAQCALFLASDRSRYITGVAIPVDGGATLRGPARG